MHPLLDPEIVSSLQELGILEDIFALLKVQGEAHLRRLEEHLEAGDRAEFRTAAHQAKGAFDVAGVTGVARLIAELERAPWDAEGHARVLGVTRLRLDEAMGLLEETIAGSRPAR